MLIKLTKTSITFENKRERIHKRTNTPPIEQKEQNNSRIIAALDISRHIEDLKDNDDTRGGQHIVDHIPEEVHKPVDKWVETH